MITIMSATFLWLMIEHSSGIKERENREESILPWCPCSSSGFSFPSPQASAIECFVKKRRGEPPKLEPVRFNERSGGSIGWSDWIRRRGKDENEFRLDTTIGVDPLSRRGGLQGGRVLRAKVKGGERGKEKRGRLKGKGRGKRRGTWVKS